MLLDLCCCGTEPVRFRTGFGRVVTNGTSPVGVVFLREGIEAHCQEFIEGGQAKFWRLFVAGVAE